MGDFINYNGEILPSETPIVPAGSRGLRYGDGVFETMKMVDGEIKLETYHFERLFAGLDLMHFRLAPGFTGSFLKDQVRALATKNALQGAVRVRLNVFRKSGGLYDSVDDGPAFVIEAWELPENFLQLNQNGLIVDIYRDVAKSCDRFSSIKSNNYLPYVMAALFAKDKKFDDCFILNTHGRVSDSTIANVFWIEDEVIYTPPLSEGGIAGVMRRHLLETLPRRGYRVLEKVLEVDNLESADELFLTNAIAGIRWVKQFRGREYTTSIAAELYSFLT